MTRVILHGACGYMGKVVASLAAEDSDIEVVCGLDVKEDEGLGFTVYTDMDQCNEDADVVIDFSVAQAVDALMDFCEERRLPVVLCTTGLSDEQLARVEALSQSVPVLRSANMSLGVNVLLSLVKQAAAALSPAGFDMEVVERHHNRKLDAPSGTALALADAMKEGADDDFSYVYDRSTKRQPRDAKEIGISAVRGGNLVGMHEAIFAGTDEIISINHQATSRTVFGKGAIEAAKFLSGRSAGLYSMQDVIAQEG